MKCSKCNFKSKSIKKSLKCKYCGNDILPAGDDENFKTYSFKEDPEIMAELDKIGKKLSKSRKGKVTRSKLIRLALRQLKEQLS